jgi:hypothetical protein
VNVAKKAEKDLATASTVAEKCNLGRSFNAKVDSYHVSCIFEKCSKYEHFKCADFFLHIRKKKMGEERHSLLTRFFAVGRVN